MRRRTLSAALACLLVAACGPDSSAPPTEVANPPPASKAAPVKVDPKQSMSNLKEIGIALHNHHDVHRNLPGDITAKDGAPLLSWRVAILPYIEKKELYDQFKLDEPWDSPANKSLIAKMPTTYAADGNADTGLTVYRGFAGPGMYFEPGKKRTFASFTDGTSNTLAVVEAAEPVIWTKPGGLDLGAADDLPDGDFRVLCVDAATYTVKPDYDRAEFRKLLTVAGGEVVDKSKVFAARTPRDRSPSTRRTTPATRQAPPATRRVVLKKGEKKARVPPAMNSLRQLGIAVHTNYEAQGKLLNDITDKNGKPLLSWRVAILPHIEETALYDQFKLDEPWDSKHNKKLVEKMPKLFAAGDAKPGKTPFISFADKGTAFEPGITLKFRDFTDGLSYTVLVATTDSPVEWTKPGGLKLKDIDKMPDGGFFVLMANGSVRSVKPGFDRAEFRKALTRADGKVFDDEAFGQDDR